jgi:hypothetical protein
MLKLLTFSSDGAADKKMNDPASVFLQSRGLFPLALLTLGSPWLRSSACFSHQEPADHQIKD